MLDDIRRSAEVVAVSRENLEACASELAAMQVARKMDAGVEFCERTDRDGRTIYIARCPNGHHESYTSHEHALYSLLDSHRTRYEDTPECHARIMAWGPNIDAPTARTWAAQFAREVREKYPAATPAEHDAYVSAAIIQRESDRAGRPPTPAAELKR